MNYGQRFVTLYRRQGARLSTRKRNAKKEGWKGEMKEVMEGRRTGGTLQMERLHEWLIQAGLRDTAGLVPEYGRKMNI